MIESVKKFLGLTPEQKLARKTKRTEEGYNYAIKKCTVDKQIKEIRGEKFEKLNGVDLICLLAKLPTGDFWDGARKGFTEFNSNL